MQELEDDQLEDLAREKSRIERQMNMKWQSEKQVYVNEEKQSTDT